MLNHDEWVSLVTHVVIAELREQKRFVPVGVSARHLHVSRADLDVLYGSGYRLKPLKPLMAGDFAAEETVTLIGPNLSALEKVRILGPERPQTQIELARTDTVRLGINPPVRKSGDLSGSAGLVVVGPKGAVTLREGCILANRHLHMTPEDAAILGLQDNESVDVQIMSEKGGVLKQIQVRVQEKARTELHIDTDDANAMGLRCGDRVLVTFKKQEGRC